MSLALPTEQLALQLNCPRWEITPRRSDRERVIVVEPSAALARIAQLFRSSLYSHSHKFLGQSIPIYIATMSLPSDGLPRPYPQLPNSMLECVLLSRPHPRHAADPPLIPPSTGSSR